MITGIGFTEIVAILVLVLLFFGSKELPAFIREGARMWGRLKRYHDSFRKELDQISRELSVDTIAPPATTVHTTKQELRERFREKLRNLTPDQREEESRAITAHVLAYPPLVRARALMLYLNLPLEVTTRNLITDLKKRGIRIIVPYCRTPTQELGIAEINDIDADTRAGFFAIDEPLPHLRDNFLKSDIGAVICPGLAFDRFGGRLGRGKGYYDRFVSELRGRVPLVGLAFGCQIAADPLPRMPQDIVLDQIMTAHGALMDPAPHREPVEHDDVHNVNYR